MKANKELRKNLVSAAIGLFLPCLSYLLLDGSVEMWLVFGIFGVSRFFLFLDCFFNEKEGLLDRGVIGTCLIIEFSVLVLICIVAYKNVLKLIEYYIED